MKKLTLALLVLIISSCACRKNNLTGKALLSSPCPKDGTCNVEITPGKTVTLKTTEDGSLYYVLEDQPNMKVIKYVYNRTVKGDLQDASYREEVIFELADSQNSFQINDTALQNHKVIFGRFCYCKGQAGYYAINEGSLSVTETSETKKIVHLKLKTDKVPQIISEVSFSLE